MTFKIDYKSGMPFYRQIIDQVRYAASAGSLRSGDMLPPIRPLSQHLRLNRNTVAKAYLELENLGVIQSVPGKGSFLKRTDSPFSPKIRQALLKSKIDDALVTADQLSVEMPEFLQLLQERSQALHPKKAKTKIAPDQFDENQRKEPSASADQANSANRSPGRHSAASGDLENWTPSSD